MLSNLSSSKIIVPLTFMILLGVSCSRLVSNNNKSPQPTAETLNQSRADQDHIKSPLPPPTGYVNDYAKVFDPASKERLESTLGELKEKSDIEFAVVTIQTTGGQPISDYSLAVMRGWGVGPKDPSRGGALLLMLAIDDRQWRLQVSRSLEKDLPDDVSKELGERSVDQYRQREYAEGIIKYVKAIIERLGEKRGFSLSRHL